jgi:cellulose biosynthesis protein BcsS
MQVTVPSLGFARAVIACATVLSVPCAPRAADKPQACEIDAGFDAAPQSLYWYKEAIVALNRDIAKSGFLMRLSGGVAVYNYAGPTGATIDGTLWQFDAMPGYQYVRGAETFGASIGLDYQDSLLSPSDPTNPVRGTALGFKVAVNYEFEDDKKPFEASLASEYSTAFETYYAELRVGARLSDKLSLGPAAEVDGTTGYNGQRLGAYATYDFDLAKGVTLDVTIVGGHQFVSGDGQAGPSGGAGTYGTLELTTNF